MAKFAKNVDPKKVAATQSANVMKQIQGSIISSVGTVRNYEVSLSKVAEYANKYLECGLRDLTTTQAHQYLTDRSVQVGQKTLDMERQAIQCMMQNVSKELPQSETLNVIKSEYKQVLSSRSYSQDQIKIVSNSQNERNSLATQIAYSAGLRAHELFTIQRIEERNIDVRPADNAKFSLRDGVRYSVEGKGGLIREIQISKELSNQLEQHRLSTPKEIVDRHINYRSNYDIAGGKKWGDSFSAASKRSLNWSAGAHGLRHSYAQERMKELQSQMPRTQALRVISQEMGHFRPEITEVYLR